MFKHAGKSGAKIFDGVKVKTIDIVPDSEASDLGRPVCAAWSRKNSSSGVTKFEYLVDATGRAGLVSTKYLKNRKYISGLKNVANWGYWKGASDCGVGTPPEGQLCFEALGGTFLLKFLPSELSNADAFRFRREWLGLEYPLPQWYYVRRSGHESGPLDIQEESNGPPV